MAHPLSNGPDVIPTEPLSGSRPVGQRLHAAVTSPRFWLIVHAVGAVVWLGLSIPGMTVWRNSISFVVFISLYAIVLSHVVGAVAAIGARKADDQDPL